MTDQLQESSAHAGEVIKSGGLLCSYYYTPFSM